MKLFLLRHGETFDNVQEFIVGHLPGKLTANGERQVLLPAQEFADKEINFSKIYCSDLHRTRQTFDILNQVNNFESPCEFTDEVRERFFGEYEGCYRADFVWEEETKKQFNYPKNGESVEELMNRAKAFLDKCMEKHMNQNVLVVSHGQFILALINTFMDRELKDLWGSSQIDNASINILEIDDDGTRKERINLSRV